MICLAVTCAALTLRVYLWVYLLYWRPIRNAEAKALSGGRLGPPSYGLKMMAKSTEASYCDRGAPECQGMRCSYCQTRPWQ